MLTMIDIVDVAVLGGSGLVVIAGGGDRPRGRCC